MDTLLFLSTCFLLLSACSGLVLIRSSNAPLFLTHWLLGWIGQSFAPQLAIIGILIFAWLLVADTLSAMHIFLDAMNIAAVLMFVQIYRRGNRHTAIAPAQPMQDCAEARATAETATSISTGISPPGFRPFFWPRANISKIRNVAYGDSPTHNLVDIYRPRHCQSERMPVLIQIPGGAWISSTKNIQAQPMLHHLAANGWLCFAINYRVGPRFRFPDIMADILQAIAWVKQHAHAYGGDPSFIALAGESAGGHLASLAGLLRNRAQFQPGFETVDTRVSAVVSIYGRYDFLDRHNLLGDDGVKRFLAEKVMPCAPAADPELWNAASPIAQVNAEAPPFMIIHGTHDSMIPITEAREFHTALSAVSLRPVTYLEIFGAQHGFDIVNSNYCANALPAIQNWLDEIRRADFGIDAQERSRSCTPRASSSHQQLKKLSSGH